MTQWGRFLGRLNEKLMHKLRVFYFHDEMEDIIEIVERLEDSDVILKWVSETIQNETKEQNIGFLSML